MKGMFKHALLCALIGFVAAAAPAQGVIEVPKELTPGSSITVTYVNPSMAGREVTILVTALGDPQFEPVPLVVQLDADGRGSAPWVVLDWFGAVFNAEEAEEVTRDINPLSWLPIF